MKVMFFWSIIWMSDWLNPLLIDLVCKTVDKLIYKLIGWKFSHFGISLMEYITYIHILRELIDWISLWILYLQGNLNTSVLDSSLAGTGVANISTNGLGTPRKLQKIILVTLKQPLGDLILK